MNNTNDKELVLQAMREYGRSKAAQLQEASAEMTGTEPEPGDGEEDIPAFVQPTGAHDAYQTGDRVTYNGHIYESTINNNVWSPDTYPQGRTELGPVGGPFVEEEA